MGNIFNIDSKPVAILGRITDLILLSLLWILCSVPIITIGVSTTALYYVTLKMARKDDVHIFRMFFAAIKENFKQGIIITCLLLLLSTVFCLDYILLTSMEGMMVHIIWILIPVSLLFVMTTNFVFPLQAQYSSSIPQTFKNAFLLSLGNIPSSILIIFLNILPGFFLLFPFELLIRLLPVLVFLSPAGIAYLCSLRYVKIFEKLEKSREDLTFEIST